jgi:glutathione S-transferase
MTVAAALQLKGLEFDRVDLAAGPHVEQMQEIYGEGHSTVPGLMIDDEPVHGSRTILARLEEIEPEPVLYPSEEVREAERWGDEVFQDLGRRLPWGALHFRPELLATMFGGSQLDGPGTDYAIRMIRAGWKYHGITAARLHDDLAELPGKLDHIEQLVSSGVIGGEQPNAADLQIGATVTVLLPLGDLGGLLSGSGAELLSRRNFPPLAGTIPAGTYPAGWVPAR